MASAGEGQSRDTLVGILGAAVLVAAMVGVFAFERSQFREYDVTWSMEEAGSRTMNGTLDEGDTDPHPITLTDDDLPEGRAMAQVRATVEWTDDVGDPDTFSVAIAGPGDRSAGPAEDDGGSVTVEAAVVPEPDATTASGRTPEDAEDQAAAQLDAGQGLGEWTIEVTLEEAPGEPDDGIPPAEPADGSNDYTLTVAWDVWEPSVSD